jgi:dTDP-4-dehydrorhamnose 3,5-epimerase-like enzyme
MNKPRLIKLDKIGSPSTGYISVVEENDQIPFEIKRVYWTYFTPNHVERGKHAHKRLEQLIVAVSGIIKFTLTDINNTKQQFILDNPNIGLYIPNGYWRDIQFSHNAVLLCLASEKYDEKDYVRDYQEFLKVAHDS